MAASLVNELRKYGGKEDQAFWVENSHHIALTDCSSDGGPASTEVGHGFGMEPAVENCRGAQVDQIAGPEPLHGEVEGVRTLQNGSQPNCDQDRDREHAQRVAQNRRHSDGTAPRDRPGDGEEDAWTRGKNDQTRGDEVLPEA